MKGISLLELLGFSFALVSPVFVGKEFYFIALMCTLVSVYCLTPHKRKQIEVSLIGQL